MRILVVDDNRPNQRLLEAFFTTVGHDVCVAGNGAEGLKEVKAGQVDLIISDILMPEMDGYAFCREVRSLPAYQSVPFIFYSGTYTTEQDVRFGLSLGANRFLFKPLLPSELLKEIEDVLKTTAPRARMEKTAEHAAGAEDEDGAFYKKHSERLSSKLVDKMNELEEKNKKLEELSQKIISGFEDERKRIAMEIHDEVLQLLLSVKIEIDVVLSDDSLPPEQLKKALPEISARCRDVISSLRLLSHSLYPPMFEDTGLFHHVRRLAETMKKGTALMCEMALEGEDMMIPPVVSLTAYRVLQEGLANVRRHSSASRCALFVRSAPGELKFKLEDTGSGFDVENTLKSSASIGLFSMMERVRIAGGTLSIKSKPGEGTELEIVIPY